MKKAQVKKILSKIITEERAIAKENHKKRVKGWEEKYVDSLTERVYNEVIKAKDPDNDK